MPIVLTLLDGVCWRGRPVGGDRSRALLAALAAGNGRAVSRDHLVDAVWGERAPGNAAKALQVVVSRTRAQCGADAVVSERGGYRLGVSADQVDVLRLADVVGRAHRQLSAGDPVAAREAVDEAAELLGSRSLPNEDEDGGVLSELRRAALARRTELTGLRGRALSDTGDHAEALPALEEAFDRDPADEAVLACLLRSEASVRSAAAALDRYERYRTGLRDRLGVDPGERLRQVHKELLALDQPVRDGVGYDTTPLVGRDDDVRRLRGLVRSARVVSIVGAGGLGKTRLAHVLGRDADQPVVHLVELVAVTTPEDLVGEIGSALGVRDSVSARHRLTPQQRADVRARIAQHLAAAPSLLILDNCEHLVDAVADLVAFLVASAPALRVVTTSRAPLAIGAEHVYPLGELDGAESAELFRRRAVAARPTVQLPDRAVADLVARLDGLPLAIELAAAKVRVMSVEEIHRRLADRFTLLRGGVRNAPDRHRTLTAVIDWSWNLLDDTERVALRQLSVFQDGFTLDAAESMLGAGALSAVHALVDQSLLSVAETGAGVRFRMLETVREFGRVKLTEAGEEERAYAARRAWATRYARSAGERLFGPDQLAAIDALSAEEGNLADALRHALTAGEPDSVMQLLHGLCGLWTVRGEHTRVISLAHPVGEVVSGWSPGPDLVDVTRRALAAVLHNTMIAVGEQAGPVRDLLTRLGTTGRRDPPTDALVEVALLSDPARRSAFSARLDELTTDPDPCVASAALQLRSHVLENDGDPASAVVAAERSLDLTREDVEGPWSAANMHAHLAGLHMQLGNHAAAVAHARASAPVLERLGALDDLVQMQMNLVSCAIAEGDLDDAAERLHQVTHPADLHARTRGRGGGARRPVVYESVVSIGIGTAELALARGDRAGGLAEYRTSVARIHGLVLPGWTPTGLEPWVLFGEASALTAFAFHGTEDEPEGAELFDSCRRRVVRVLAAENPHPDYPVMGMVLYALGVWCLIRLAVPADDAVRLLVLADRFGYNRTIPTMAWENAERLAEEQAPGRAAALRAEYGDRRGPALLGEARHAVGRLG